MYIGLPSNPQFLGLQSPQDVAEVVVKSTGPSGANAEYLFMLEESLMDLGEGSWDGHVRDLAGRVRSLMSGINGKGVRSDKEKEADSVMKLAVKIEVERARSGEDAHAGEETEKVSQLQR